MARLRAIISFVLMVWLALAHAAEKKGDVPGCHEVPDTESYECDSGPLAGREFVTKEEAQDAMDAFNEKAKEEAAVAAALATQHEPPAVAPLKKETVPRDHLVLMSWNMRALKQETSDYDRAAIVLGDADLIALQEVDLRGNGKGFINVLANLIQDKSQEKICRAWIQAGSGERQTYAFLWKEKRIGFLDDSGEMKDRCGDTALTIRQASKSKASSQATFIFKPQRKMFVFGTTFTETKPKTADKHVNEVFRPFNDGKFPVVVAGDMKMGPGNSAFTPARKMGFRSAINGNRKAWDNFWFRGASLESAGPVDLYSRFSDQKKDVIDKGFTGIFPIVAEFSLKEKAVEDTVSLVKKKPKPRN